MTTFTQAYGNITVGTVDPLAFQNISLSETDTVTGSATISAPFATSAGAVQPFSQNPPSEIGFGWGGLVLDDFSNGGSSNQLLNFTYNVTASAGQLVSAVAPIYAVDFHSGTGRMVAIENVFDSSNNLIGSNTFDTSSSLIATTTTLSEDVQTAHVQLTIDMTTAAAGDEIAASIIAQDFLQTAGTTTPVPSVGIDKQISPDGGTTWLDVGAGVLNNPIVLAGTTLQERVIVTNTGSVALTNLSVSDLGAGPASFAVGSSLAVGASETSAVGTYVSTGAMAGVHQFDTATVTGTGTVGGTVTASDTADFTPVTPAVSLDKQISPDGGATWVDVGVGVLNDPIVLAGTTLQERVIVTNTGSMALTNLSVTDVGAGPASFAVGSSLAVGGSETSAIGTYVSTTAMAGVHQFDTATVTGTATDTYGHSTTVTAGDTADFTPVLPAISLDKQISPNGGATWVDVGVGVLNDPIVLAGTTLQERVIVTNTGSVALTNLSVTDVGAGPASFAVGSSLAVSASETSAIGTYVSTGAMAGVHQFDTATVTGTATVGGTPTTVTAHDTADFTPVTPAVALDKQISPDGGTTWLDVGAGVLNNPLVLAGTTLQERVIVTNTGSMALTNLSVTDVGAGPASFAVGSSLAVGASETSAVGTYVSTVAMAGVHQFDTATVTGTATDTYGHSTTVTAGDTADFTPETPAVSLDKQISTDGTIWTDVGVGNLSLDPTVTAGSNVYERVIVTNTGSMALTNLTVSDVGGNGPASFAVGSTLAVGGSEISAVATIAAAVGYQLDTATVTGTGSDSYGHSQGVTASDQANYTGASSQLPPTTSLTILKVPCVTAINECGCGGGSSGGSGCGGGSSGGSGCGGGSSGGGGSSCGGSSSGGSYCGGSSSGGSSCDTSQNWGSFGGGSSSGGSSYDSSSSCGGSSYGGSSSCGGSSYGGSSSCGGSSYGGSSSCGGSSYGGSSSCGGSSYGGGSSCGSDQWGSFCGGSSGGGSSCGGSSGSSGCGSGGGSTCTGQGVTYTYTVTNTGTTTLYNVTVKDVVNGGTTTTFTDSNSLAAGASWTFTDTTYANTAPPLNGTGSSTAYGSTDTATASATTTSSKTSTAATPANTEARVQIGNAASSDDVQIGGTAPSGSVFKDFTGSAAVIEFNYNPAGNTNATAGQTTGAIIATSTGSTPSSPAFIVVDNVASDSTSGATLYFEGTVAKGMNFYADSTVNALTGAANASNANSFAETLGGNYLYAHIFASQAAFQAGQAATQEIKYSVSGAAPVDVGDTIGSLKVAGYVSTTNQGYAV